MLTLGRPPSQGGCPLRVRPRLSSSQVIAGENWILDWLSTLEAPTIGQQMPHPLGTIQLILLAITASRSGLKAVLRTAFKSDWALAHLSSPVSWARLGMGSLRLVAEPVVVA